MTLSAPVFDQTDQLCANTARMLAIDAVAQANSGHPGLPLGVADIATVLWRGILKHNPANPTWLDRDRFVLSAGHGSALLYALLHIYGYPLSMDDLRNFRQWGSVAAGHPEFEPEIGIEITTGPLGQGISNAVGMAMTERWLAARFNRPDFPLVDHYTYVIVGDGDLQEGVSQEASSLAGHLHLGKLIVLYDDNGITIDGSTEASFSDDVPGRYAAYGWHTQTVDGHDMPAIDAALRAAQAVTDRPSLIACKTHIGLGSPLQDTAGVHGSPLKGDNLVATKAAFGWNLEPFTVPPAVTERLAEVQQAGAADNEAWDAMFARYAASYPELAAEWQQQMAGTLPADWASALPDFADEKPMATRATSGKVLDALTPQLPILLGGSADLTGSNKTKAKSAAPLTPTDFSGAYVYYGVREHGMAAIMNGMAAHGGVRPFGGTFLAFVDYMRGAVRMSALMGVPVVYVFTHDSIGLGEDGPTHQPIEQINSLRIIPNMVVIRPADGNETSQAWRVALERTTGPTALILTRQNLPQVSPFDNDLAKGAYVLSEAADGPAQVVLLATGSEVELALAAQRSLAAEGVAARVVSMPSCELFDAQPQAYRDEILPPNVPTVAVEAGSTQVWFKYTGTNGAIIGLDRFGASAPYETIYREFGITAEAVAAAARELLNG